MHRFLHLLAVAVACVSASCSSSPSATAQPIEVSTIAGEWRGDDVVLSISHEGLVHYRTSGTIKREMTGLTAKNVTNEGFDVGVFGIDTHFSIEALPHDVDGRKVMRVDGTDLVDETPTTP